MPSVVEVCNKALDKLGHGAITSLNDGTKAANLCLRSWEMVRDEMLRAHPWNFAVKRLALAPSDETPAWGFSYAFPIPSDYLRMIEILDSAQFNHQIESNNILCDETVLYVRYIYKVTDPNQYDSMFVDVVATRLAIELCEPLTQSNTKKNELIKDLDAALTNAKRVDGQENPPVSFAEDDWITARL